MSSFKSNENIHKKEDGSYYVVSANKAVLALNRSLQTDQDGLDYLQNIYIFPAMALY